MPIFGADLTGQNPAQPPIPRGLVDARDIIQIGILRIPVVGDLRLHRENLPAECPLAIEAGRWGIDMILSGSRWSYELLHVGAAREPEHVGIERFVVCGID